MSENDAINVMNNSKWKNWIISGTTYYERNRGVRLNRGKDYYENNKELLGDREQKINMDNYPKKKKEI